MSWVEKKSRENLVGMYRQELLRVVEGGHCADLIPRGIRKRMRREGILLQLGNRYSVTSLGIEMIQERTFSKRGQDK